LFYDKINEKNILFRFLFISLLFSSAKVAAADTCAALSINSWQKTALTRGKQETE